MADATKFKIAGQDINVKDSGAIRYDGVQTLTPAQAAQARQNIGAAAPTPVATSLPASGGLLPNVFYNLGAISAALNLSTLAAAIAGVYNEYQVQFALEATLTDVPTITLPADVIWGENGAPSSKFEKGYIFQISITNEGGYLLGEWDRFAIPASE